MSNAINIAGFIAIAATLSACSDNNPPTETNPDMSGNVAESTVADASDQKGALGLTVKQLSDADILNANGIEIGGVERVITDSSGAVTKLLVEIEDSDPDRFVELSLDGLTPKQQGDDWDLEANMSKDDLIALPEVK